MLEHFPSFNEWASLWDKVLEKSLETGCRIVVKLSEKTMQFLDLAEQRFPQVKEFVSPWLNPWRNQSESQCEATRSLETPISIPENAHMEDRFEGSISKEDSPSQIHEEARHNEAFILPSIQEEKSTFLSAQSTLAEQLRELPNDFLQSVFSQKQLLKVLYLMAVSEKKWLVAQEIAQMGDTLNFPILPQNVRKVIQQKALDTGLVRVRERAGARRGAKEFQLTSKGESYLKSNFQLH